MAADRQVVERDKDGEPVRRAMGDGQGLGEELRSRLVVPLSEPDLAEEVVTPGQPSAIAGRGELVRIQLPDQVLALVEQVAGASALWWRASRWPRTLVVRAVRSLSPAWRNRGTLCSNSAWALVRDAVLVPDPDQHLG